MQCVICKQGDTYPGETRVTLERDGSTVIIKGVPAMICDNCGEYYLDETMTARVLSIAEQAVDQGTEVEVRRFAAWPPERRRLGPAQRLIDIPQDIVDVLAPNRQPDHIRPHTGGNLLRLIGLPVGGGCGVNDERAGVTDIG